MKIRAFQLNVIPGNPQQNCASMLAAISRAKMDEMDIIIFPEMAIPGYLLGDEWERNSFLKECEDCGDLIRLAAQGITIIFGNIALQLDKKNEDGRPRKYNACFVAEDQTFIQHPHTGLPFFIKFLMPNYREFDDNRHFYDPRKLAYELSLGWSDLIQPAATKHGKLGCIICEDGWDHDYNISPSTLLSQQGAIILINISSSPYTFSKNQKRYRVFSEQALRCGLPLVYTNAVGLQDNGKTLFTFDGSTCIYNRQGNLVKEATAYCEMPIDMNFNEPPPPFPPNQIRQQDNIAQQYEAIIYGTRTFLERAGIHKIVIGVSGGIDSAVVAAIYRQILPKGNLLLVNMPGPFSSVKTRSLAKELAENLDLAYAEIPIGDAATLTQTQIESTLFHSHSTKQHLQVSDFVLENIQARDRSSRVLAAVAAAFGGAFTCNANKSEMTVGYSTLYGDLGGCLASIADLWKGEVYELAAWLNANIYHGTGIPQGSISIVPSAELSALQNIELGQGDPLNYPYHDALFRSWVEHWERATPEDNLNWYLQGTLAQQIGYSGDLTSLFAGAEDFIQDLERWWNLYQGMAIAKRIQAPPIIAVKRRAFGFDHREAQMGPRYSARYHQLKLAALAH